MERDINMRTIIKKVLYRKPICRKSWKVIFIILPPREDMKKTLNNGLTNGGNSRKKRCTGKTLLKELDKRYEYIKKDRVTNFLMCV